MPRAKRSFDSLSAEEGVVLEDLTRAFHYKSREEKTHANRNRFVRYYTELCGARGKRVFPADEFDVACFLVKFCSELESVASLSNALSAIRTEAKEVAGQVFSDQAEWYLGRVCRGLRKQYRAATIRKRPMTLDVLVELLLKADLHSLCDLQLITMGLLCHNACLRMKELLALKWSDIEWELDSSGRPVLAIIRIEVSKARYEEAAESVRIPLFQVDGILACAVQLLWLYMRDARVLARKARFSDPFLFPSLQGQNRRGKDLSSKAKARVAREGYPMGRKAVLSWYDSHLEAAGFVSKEFAGHSFRAGGATDLHSGQVPEVLGRLLGRWRCREAYMVYLRENPTIQAAKISAAFEAAWGVHKKHKA